MGASSSKQPPPPCPTPPPPLAPVPPIGLYPQFTTHPEEMALIVRQKFSGDYYAKDAVTGQQVFTIRSKDFSFSRSNKIEDAEGQRVISLEPRTRSNTRRPKIDGFDSRSLRPGAGPPPPVLKVEFRSETSADVMFRDRCSPAGAEQDVVLLLETNYTCDRGTVFLPEGRPLARMQPSHRRSYETLLSISQGADAALMTALCIIMKGQECLRSRARAGAGAMGGSPGAAAAAGAAGVGASAGGGGGCGGGGGGGGC